jgi:SAM-dependent methyltransferase
MNEHSKAYYDRFYENQGWNYDYHIERLSIESLILPHLNSKRKQSVLDLGCGDGFHAKIWSDLGFQVCGIDNSIEGIKRAQLRSESVKFYCINAQRIGELFNDSLFDFIYCRGMSWYHYELNSQRNRFGICVDDETQKIFRCLKSGGIFILQIATDFSSTEDAASGILNNPTSAYTRLFEKFGEIVRILDWQGGKLSDGYENFGSFGVIIFVRKN